MFKNKTDVFVVFCSLKNPCYAIAVYSTGHVKAVRFNTVSRLNVSVLKYLFCHVRRQTLRKCNQINCACDVSGKCRTTVMSWTWRKKIPLRKINENRARARRIRFLSCPINLLKGEKSENRGRFTWTAVSCDRNGPDRGATVNYCRFKFPSWCVRDGEHGSEQSRTR